MKMEKTKTLLIDLDDTVAECTKRWLMVLNRQHDLSIAIDDIKVYGDPAPLIEQLLGVSKEEALKIVREPFHQKGFFESLIPIKDAVDSVNLLFERGFNIVWATTVPSFDAPAAVEKEEWLRKHFPEIFPYTSYVPLIPSVSKSVLSGDFILEDAVHNIINSKGIHTTVLFEKSWNKNHAHGADYVVKDWREAVKLFDRLFPDDFYVDGGVRSKNTMKDFLSKTHIKRFDSVPSAHELHRVID